MSINIGTIEGLIRLRDEFTPVLKKAHTQAESFATRTSALLNKQIGSISPLGAMAFAGAVGLAMKSVYDNVAEAQKAFAQLEAGVRSTGGAAGYSAEQLAEMAGELQRLTGAEDEALMGAQSLLLTFTNITGDAFPKALQMTADLSARLGMDLNSAATMAGKALNLPSKGVQALTRAGIQFTEGQKQTIKSFEDTNRLAEAQAIIFAEVERQVGGSAEAFRNTLPGAIAALQGAWGNLLEEVGNSASSGGFFRTGIEGMVSALDFLADHWHELESAVFTTLGQISSALARAVDIWLENVQKFARALQIINPGTWFGAGKQGFDDLVGRIDTIRETVRQTGDDFRVGFEEKAAEAIEAAIAPTKGLDKSLRTMADTSGSAANAAKKLAKEVDGVSAKLRQSIDLNNRLTKLYLSGATAKHIADVRKSHTIHVQYLEDVEKLGKKAADSILALRNADQKALESAEAAEKVWQRRLDHMEEFSNRTSQIMDRLADEGLTSVTDQINRDLTDAASLTASMATEAERWAAEEARALELLNHPDRLITQETYDRLLRSHTQQLQKQESSYERQRRIVSEIAGEIGNWAGVLNEVFGGVNDQVGQVLSGVQTFTSALQAYNREGATWSERAMAGVQMGQGIFQAGQGFGLWQGNRGTGSFGGQMSGDYADVGAMVGGIFGPWWGVVGAVIGSFIKKGADEGLARIFLDLKGEINTGANSGRLHEATSGIAHSIATSLEQIMNAVGGELAAFPDILVKIRDDIITITVGNIQRRFKDTEAALAFAISEALRQADIVGLSPEMQAAMENTAAQTVEEFLRDIQTAQWAERIPMSDMEIRIDDITKAFLANFDKLIELGIDTAGAVSDYHQQLSTLKDELLGFNRSTAEYLRNLFGFNEGIDEAAEDMRRRIEGNVAEIQRQIDNLLTTGRGTLEIPKPGGQAGEMITVRQTQQEWENAIAELRRQQEAYLEQLNDLPERMSEAEIDMGIFQSLFQYLEDSGKYAEQAHKYALMRVEIEFESIRLQLIAMNKWEQFAQMFSDAYEAARRQAGEEVRGGRGRGSGGGSNRGDVREWLADRQADIASRSMTQYAAQIAEVNRLYSEQIAQAGRDIGLRTQLIALRDEELALLRKEQVDDIAQRFRSIIGLVSRFDEIRQSTSEFIADINSSPLGDSRKANMIARVLLSMEQTIQRMSLESARGLLGEMVGDLQQFGASQALISEAQRHMALIEHTLKMEHYRTEIEILKAQGTLSAEVLAALESSLEFIGSIDPTDYIPWVEKPYTDWWGTNEEAINAAKEAAKKAADELKRAQDLLGKYQSDGLLPVVRQMRDINKDFEEIFRVIGRNAETVTAHSEAIARALDDFLEPIRQVREDLFFGQLSPMDTETQWQRAVEEFLAAQRAFESGDLSVIEDLPELARRLLELTREMTPVGSEAFDHWAEIVDELLERVEQVTPEDVLNDPVAMGLSELADVSSDQLSELVLIRRSNETIAASLSNMNQSSGGSRIQQVSGSNLAGVGPNGLTTGTYYVS